MAHLLLYLIVQRLHKRIVVFLHHFMSAIPGPAVYEQIEFDMLPAPMLDQINLPGDIAAVEKLIGAGKDTGYSDRNEYQ